MTASPDRARVLIVDDDRSTREGLNRALRSGYDVTVAESGERALDILSAQPFDILLTDLRMPGIDGIVLMRRAIAAQPGLVVMLLTAYGTVETAVDAMRLGAADYLTKPIKLDELEMRLQRALRSRRLETENLRLKAELDEKFGLESLIGNSASMRELYDTIRQAAPTQATVMVQGESGTGKELVAHAVHRLSTRSRGPFVAVHCAALAANLLESELFGHEKGAYTGATAQRPGRFELADGGTLFLDEISEVDPAIQVKLLRVLEERSFERVGGNDLVEVDIRLVAATNRDLKQLVETGEFREDLFFRLDVISIRLPPLRERQGDVPLLCDHFVREFCDHNNREIDGLTPDALSILAAYRWPGNVRELRNTIEKMVVLSRGDRLTARDVPANIRDAVRATGVPVGRAPAPATGDSLAEAERRMIQAALQRNRGNRTKAAEDLGISRRTLHRKLRQYREEEAGAEGSDERS